MKLYNSIGPNPRVVRIALAEKGIDVETVAVDLMAGENRQAAYTAKNPSGQLPCLELDDGRLHLRDHGDLRVPGRHPTEPADHWHALPRSAPRPACGLAASI